MDGFADDLDAVLRELLISSLAGDFAREIHRQGEDGPLADIHYADGPDERVVVDIPHDADRPAMRELLDSALDGLIRARDPEYLRRRALPSASRRKPRPSLLPIHHHCEIHA